METLAITKLYNATLEGDEQSLHKLLHDDPLILERCIIEKSRYYTQSPLHVAANMGHLHIIKILLQKKPNMCIVHDQDGMTPLHVAASMGHSHIINILLQTKPNMCFVHDQDGMTPIHVATINGKTDMLKKLYDEIPHAFRERTNDGETILHLCIKHNKMEVLKFLLDHVDAELLNSKDNDGNTILHLAVIGNQYEIPDAIRERTNGGETVLHLCIKQNKMEVLRCLLDRVDAIPHMIRERTNNGETVLHLCIKHNKMEVLRCLLDRVDAIPHAIREWTNDGETVLHLCIKHNKMEALKVLLDHVDAELLNSKDNDGNTTLHLAVIGNQYEMVKVLLEDERIKKNAENKNGSTAMDSHILLVKPKKKINNNIFSRFFNEILYWNEGDVIGPLLESSKVLRAKDAAKLKLKNKNTYVESQGNALMVVASLIATMAFQVALNPPGGLWQDDKDGEFGHRAGLSIWETTESYNSTWIHPNDIRQYFSNGQAGWLVLLVSNTIALASSFSVILLLISGFSFGRHFVAILRITMWIAITAITVTFGISLRAVTLGASKLDATVVDYTLLAGLCLVALLVLAHVVRFLIKLINRRSKVIRCCSGV